MGTSFINLGKTNYVPYFLKMWVTPLKKCSINARILEEEDKFTYDYEQLIAEKCNGVLKILKVVNILIFF